MTKTSYRRQSQSRRDNVGCMWGLIAQKFLSDKKHGNIRNAGSGYSKIKLDSLRNFQNRHKGSLVDEIREDQVDLGKMSVKVHMEEEMFQRPQKKITNEEAQRVTSKLQNEFHPEKNSKRSEKLKVISDAQMNNLADSPGFVGHQSDSMDLTEKSLLNFDLASFLIELYSYTCQEIHAESKKKFYFLPASGSIGQKIDSHLDELDDHLDQKISFFQKTLADVAQAIISQKSMVENQLDGRCIIHSKEFINALYTLNSDKELFLKLLEDPESLLLKHIQCLHITQVGKVSKLESDKCLENVQSSGEQDHSKGKCKESNRNQLFHKQKKYSFSWKKVKSMGTSNESPSSNGLNRIVDLKPYAVRNQNCSVISTSTSTQSHDVPMHDKDRFHFSLQEIKRRLRRIIGESKKSRHIISMDGILHKIPVATCKMMNSETTISGSASSSSFDITKLSGCYSIDKRKDEKNNSEQCKVKINSCVSSSRSQSLIYEEAKKHLAEMLDTKVDSLPKVQVLESLERVLSLSRFNELCPISNPQRDNELAMPPEETGDSSLQHLKQENLIDTNMQDVSYIGEDLNNKGRSREILGAAATKSIANIKQLDVPLETNEPIVVSKICEEEEESYTLQEMGSSEERSLTLPSSFVGENSSDSESTTEKPDQPNSVSILDTFLSEDITSPESSKLEHYVMQKQNRRVSYEDSDNYLRIITLPDVKDRDRLHVNQAMYDYIRVVLGASGLMNELLERWDVTDHLLEPSLFDGVEIFSFFPQDNSKLLFDCINEVLVEIQEKFSSYTPRLSFIKRNFLPAPLGESLIQEVYKGVDRHLHLQFQNTLDQIINKDLEHRSWMNLQSETKNMTCEICDSILDDLIEETVYDMWF
ncbi:unnamed protein product [Musa acuminata subsp. malaccensis]|uniref:(wild Malaysian banana) hypothetical protein n=1 Tax=Musa acuminata subsp. malaccensis TaxID=214687 RepID=A0A8D7F3P3_MUSAM|nr:unnamed protein product [Musa acuminata subsp. malaccensis]